MAEKQLYLKIGRPNNTCTVCGVPIDSAGKHPSVLRRPGEAPPAPADELLPAEEVAARAQPASDEPRREDYCPDCWQEVTEKDYLGYWLAKRQPPKVRKIESKKERNAGVLAWFEHLRSLPETTDNLQAQFFLAHLLMKYGVFKWSRTDTDAKGNEFIYFRQTGTDEETAVQTVELSDEKSLEVKQQLDEFLVQFANAAPAEEPAAAGEPAADEE